jgi:isoleucyl-tRNA synthetase
MKGFHVARKAGWDCHGLPVELAVEKELGFTGKQDIEAYGIAEFNAGAASRCPAHRRVRRAHRADGLLGRPDDAYRTMDPEYIESVWWSLKQIFDKGLLVEDFRVAPYCPRCGTGCPTTSWPRATRRRRPVGLRPLPAHLRARSAGRASLLVWTTTPWTLVSNTAVAVHPDVTYVVATDGTERCRRRAAAGTRCSARAGRCRPVVHRRGAGALDLPRPFDLVDFPGRALRDPADYVTTEDGTGLVHQAPAFGADDLASLPRVRAAGGQPGPPDGTFEPDVPLVGGLFFKDADEPLVADLRERGLLFRHVPYEHSYPHCWRCHTALIYYAQPSWYIRTTAVKDACSAENEKTNWHPETIKHGRYGDWLATTSTGRCPATATGARRCRSGAARTTT